VFDLTPGERRGAVLLLALCALGAGWDLAHRAPRPAPPVESMRLAPPPADSAVPAPASPARAGRKSDAGPAVDLNAAGVPELDALPGIGPVLAGRIVAQRSAHGPYHAVDELLGVRGIGPRLLERLRARLVVTDTARSLPAAIVHDARSAAR